MIHSLKENLSFLSNIYQIGGSQTWAQTGYRGFRRLNLDDRPQKLHFFEYGNCCNFVNNGPILMIFFFVFLVRLRANRIWPETTSLVIIEYLPVPPTSTYKIKDAVTIQQHACGLRKKELDRHSRKSVLSKSLWQMAASITSWSITWYMGVAITSLHLFWTSPHYFEAPDFSVVVWSIVDCWVLQ